jgi:hypothetical protein
MNYAAERALRSNVIVLSASSHAALERTLEQYAWRYIDDVIRGGSIDSKQFDTWKAQTPELRASLFLAWAGDTKNNCIIILDGLDDIDDADIISTTLPKTSQVVISTRNPTISKNLDLRFRCLNRPIFQLEADEASSLINFMIASNDLVILEYQVRRLSAALDYHPFAICAASSYLRILRNIQEFSGDELVIETFLNILEGSSYEERRAFFDYGGLSAVSKLFTSAMTNLRKWSTGTAFDSTIRSLLRAIAFTSGSDQTCSFLRFFDWMNPSLLEHIPEDNEIDDIFKKGLLKGNAPETLGNMVQASLIVKLPTHTYMPPLWRDCILLYECASIDERRYWLRQVLLLCYYYSKVHCESRSMAPYIDNCIHIARRYSIPMAGILSHVDHQSWLEATLARGSHYRALNNILYECRELEETRKCSSVHIRDMQSNYAGLAIRLRALESEHCTLATDREWERMRKEIISILGTVNPFYGTLSPTTLQAYDGRKQV